MPRKYPWLGASLIVLGMTSGVLAFDWGYRHPGSIAGVIAGLNRNPLTSFSLSCSCQAKRNGSCAGQCNRPKSDAATNAYPTVVTSEAIPAEACDQPKTKTEAIQLFRALASDAAEALKSAVEMTKHNLPIEVEPVSNTLLVTYSADSYDEEKSVLTKLVRAIDFPPPQAQIDVLIVEVTSKRGKDALTIFGDGEKYRAMDNDKCAALIADLQQQGNVEVLSAPKIVTCDNQAARILVGQSYPYVTGTAVTSDTNDTPVSTNTVAYRDVGIQVQVIPKIGPDGTVVMRIVPEITAAVPTKTELSPGVFATAFNVQTLEATVIAEDGETAIVGGLVWTVDSGTTGHCHGERQTKELLVFVTPRVVNCQR
jgi:type II secretory pathway component GspD/PulD (secretin)